MSCHKISMISSNKIKIDQVFWKLYLYNTHNNSYNIINNKKGIECILNDNSIKMQMKYLAR